MDLTTLGQWALTYFTPGARITCVDQLNAYLFRLNSQQRICVCNHQDLDGKRPLHWVAIAKIIHHYLAADSINECDFGGWTALHYAAANNHVPMVEYLISVGANVNHVCDYGTERYGPSSLHVAVARGHVEVVKCLVSAGADVDYSSIDNRILFGETPLAWAVVNHRQPMVLFLIDSGCDLDKADVDGNTPLHKAGYLGYVGIIELLVTRGAKVNVKNHRNEDPLMLARRVGCQEANDYLTGWQRSGEDTILYFYSSRMS